MIFTHKRALEIQRQLNCILASLNMKMPVEILEHDEEEFSIMIDDEQYEIFPADYGKFSLILYVGIPGTYWDPPDVHEEYLGKYDSLPRCVARIIQDKAEASLQDYFFEKDLIAEEE